MAETSETPPSQPRPSRPKRGQYRVTNRAQLERREVAASKSLVVESTFDGVYGGNVTTYTGLGRSLQRQEWRFNPYGMLVGIKVEDALVSKSLSSGNENGRSAQRLLIPDAERSVDVRTAHTIELVRDSNDPRLFRLVPESERFDGNLMQEWLKEREKYVDNLTARRPNPTPPETTTPQS